jgi:LemA protein
MVISLIVMAVVVISLMSMYNTLVGRKNNVDNIFGGLDAALKKRYDLIPNLITTVKNYMQHEAGVLTQVTELRAKAASGSLSSDEKVDLDNRISKAVGGIMVAVENYPDLKASQNFIQLQRAWAEIEEQISAARRAYNGAVTDYNNTVEMLPTSIMAGMLNYQRKQVFEISEKERQNVGWDSAPKS